MYNASFILVIVGFKFSILRTTINIIVMTVALYLHIIKFRVINLYRSSFTVYMIIIICLIIMMELHIVHCIIVKNDDYIMIAMKIAVQHCNEKNFSKMLIFTSQNAFEKSDF